MIGIIGKKLGMTQIFNEQGQQIPCTVVEAAPNPVVEVTDKRRARLRRRAARLRRAAHRARRRRRARGRRRADVARTSAEIGHAKKAGLDAAPRVLRSVPARRAPGNASRRSRRTRSATRSTSTIFAPGEQVKVTGTSKGRGFQGVVKRYGIGGGPNTHGNTKHRRPGSIGPGTDPSRVIKGKKMPGHYGDARHTQIAPPRREDRRRAQSDLHPRRGRRSDERDRARPQAGLRLTMADTNRHSQAAAYTAQGTRARQGDASRRRCSTAR